MRSALNGDSGTCTCTLWLYAAGTKASAAGVVERVSRRPPWKRATSNSGGVVGLDGVGDAAKSSGEAQRLFEDEVVVALSLVVADVHADVTKGIAVRGHVAHRHVLRGAEAEAEQPVAVHREVGHGYCGPRIVVGSRQ